MKANIEKIDNEIYVKRFLMLMKLIRIDRMLKKAKIIYPKK